MGFGGGGGGDQGVRFNGFCFFCGRQGHRKSNCDKANKVLDEYLAKQRGKDDFDGGGDGVRNRAHIAF